jgi:hypothetical protein
MRRRFVFFRAHVRLRIWSVSADHVLLVLFLFGKIAEQAARRRPHAAGARRSARLPAHGLDFFAMVSSGRFW